MLCVFLLSVRFYYLRAVVSYVASVFTAYVVYDSIWPLGRIQRSNIEGKKKKVENFQVQDTIIAFEHFVITRQG